MSSIKIVPVGFGSKEVVSAKIKALKIDLVNREEELARNPNDEYYEAQVELVTSMIEDEENVLAKI